MPNIDGMTFQDTQSLVDKIRPGMSTEELIQLQAELQQAMMIYTAVSAMLKTIGDCEMGIARNF